MQQVLSNDVTAVSNSAASARKLDHELAEVLQDCATQQHKAQVCKVSLDLQLLHTQCLVASAPALGVCRHVQALSR